MKVRVRFFAALREAVGETEAEYEMPLGSKVQDLLDLLARQYPALHAYLSALHTAVNREYALHEAELHDGDEVALVPPVGGG